MDTKTNRLSYSQVRTYSECGQKYKYHYIDRLRESTKSGALLFGTAFDKAIEAVLNNASADEKMVFDKWWETQAINNVWIKLIDSLLVVYAASDFDDDLLTVDDINFIKVKAEELVPELLKEHKDWRLVYNEVFAHKKQRSFRTWPENENKFYNICNWLSLRRKGYVMLDAHRTKILPRIKKVIATQAEIELNNGPEGDTLVGYPDALLLWETGQTLVTDYKTSSIRYEDNSVLTSAQLTIYSHALRNPDAAYFVFNKRIIKNKVKVCGACGLDMTGRRFKTCPDCKSIDFKETITSFDCDIQIIIDTIPERTEDIVLENIATTNDGIKNGIFIRNFNSCQQPWGPCPYLGICFKNDKKGLVQL